jgi:hypothetical protein
MRQFFPILAQYPFLGEMILVLKGKRNLVHVRVCGQGEIRDIDEAE